VGPDVPGFFGGIRQRAEAGRHARPCAERPLAAAAAGTLEIAPAGFHHHAGLSGPVSAVPFLSFPPAAPGRARSSTSESRQAAPAAQGLRPGNPARGATRRLTTAIVPI
jgi:hypothetical protein